MQAQNAEWYSIVFHEQAGGFAHSLGLIQQHDGGDFILNTHAYEHSGNYTEIPLGYKLYKISPDTFTITDSLFLEDTARYWSLVHNPRDNGNIMFSLEYHEDCDSTFLRICHLNDTDLSINHDEDIVVPICDELAISGYWDQPLIDCNGDLIMKYYKEVSEDVYDCYMTRIGTEGTLKHQALFTENTNQAIPRFRVLKDSPLQYYQWKGYNNENLAVYVIDSLFNKNIVVINKILHEEPINPYLTTYERLAFNDDTEVIPADGDDILVAARYVYDTNNYSVTAEHGVAVAKYDLRTMQLKDYIVFNDFTGTYNQARCMGLKRMSDGTVYLIFKETPYPDVSVIIVKMDTDLHVDWKRFCKTDAINIYSPLELPILNKDEHGTEIGVVWAGYGNNTNTEQDVNICFLLNHDGPVGMDESSIVVRPYGFYPNPAKDQLHMEFSPDVQPTKVELYDLQGRLVHTQSKTFESVDMSQLPTGTYTMRVTMEDGTAYSDKVVKE
jgi:hypothetical protein